MSVDEMLASLVEDRIVATPRERHVSSLIGEFNYLGTAMMHADTRDAWGNWVPPDPSPPQIRQSLTGASRGEAGARRERTGPGGC